MLQYLICRVNSQVSRSCDSFLNVLFKLCYLLKHQTSQSPAARLFKHLRSGNPAGLLQTSSCRQHSQAPPSSWVWVHSSLVVLLPLLRKRASPTSSHPTPDCTVCHRRSISWLLVRIIRVYFKDLSVLMVILEGFSSLLHIPCDPDAWYCQRDQIWAVNLSGDSVHREQLLVKYQKCSEPAFGNYLKHLCDRTAADLHRGRARVQQDDIYWKVTNYRTSSNRLFQ